MTTNDGEAKTTQCFFFAKLRSYYMKARQKLIEKTVLKSGAKEALAKLTHTVR